MFFLKILIFCYLPNPNPNAAWRRIEFFAEYFRSKGHRVAIAGAFSLKTLDKAGLLKCGGIRIINVTPVILVKNIFSIIFNLSSSFLTSILPFIVLRPEIVIISVPPGEATLGSYAAAKFLRTKIVIDYRDRWEDFSIGVVRSRVDKLAYEFLRKIMTKCYKNSDQVITVTEDVATSLSLRGVSNVKIITNGADTNTFKPLDKINSKCKIGFAEDDFIIVYCGLIGSYYRLDVVVRAIDIVTRKASNIKLLIVGYGRGLGTVLSLTKQLCLENNVFYLGEKLNKNELVELLSASEVGIIPYDSNPKWINLQGALPVKAFEYFACGLPVIATVNKNSTIGKFINENNIGLTSDPENVAALADNIEALYKDDLFRTEAGKRAILLVKERFDRNKLSESLLHLLEGLVVA